MLVVVAVAARRLNTAPSILLVAAGIGLALIPGLPRIELAPELVLLGILPPLIYSAGVAMSWREFRFNLRPIIAARFRLRRSSPAWRGGGRGALSPRHAARGRLRARRDRGADRRGGAARHRAPSGIAAPADRRARRRGACQRRDRADPLPLRRRRGRHRRVLARHAPVSEFALIVVGEIAYGIGVGWVSLRLRRWAQDPRVEITMSLMTPYAAFLLPAHLGGSGVLATVAAGLYVSWNGPLLIPAATRLQGIFFWDLLVYLLEGMVFLVTGLQPRVADRAHGRRSCCASLRSPCRLTVAVVVIARFVWVFPATYLPRWLSPALARRDPPPPWQWTFLLAFIGVRGVVSLGGGARHSADDGSRRAVSAIAISSSSSPSGSSSSR